MRPSWSPVRWFASVAGSQASILKRATKARRFPRPTHDSPLNTPMTDHLTPVTDHSIPSVAELQEAVSAEAAKAVQGQQQVLEQMLVCLLSRGHVLLEGVPGIAKTLLAKTLAAIVGAG